jgi:8-oxo-dGTP pyrophosphatase MutT (NUDIX family)
MKPNPETPRPIGVNGIDPSVFEVQDNIRGSKALIRLSSGKYLFYIRDYHTTHYPGYVDLLGGGSESGESAFQTLVREIQEEAGLEVDKENLVHSHSFPSARDPSKSSYFSVLELSETSIKDVSWGDEGLGAIELTLDEAIEHEKIYPPLKERITEFRNALAETVVD